MDDSVKKPSLRTFVVGANNITLDLNGHTVAGTANTGDGGGVVLVGRTGVHVRNGTVRNFEVGVVIVGGSVNTVQAVTAVDNIASRAFPDAGAATASPSSRPGTTGS